MAPRGYSKKQRRHQDSRKKKRGVLTGMRSGFKNVATTVTGAEAAKAKKSRTATIISTAITLLLIAAIAAILFYR